MEIFRGTYMLPRTGIVECSEMIIDVGCNLKQYLMAWPDWPWPPYFTTDLRHCLCYYTVVQKYTV